jgi:hypothetical protein
MRPPAVAQALIAAVAPSSDYEIVAGDLHEEYLRIMHLSGTKIANRWYWAQTLLSIPPLLSYSRWNASALRGLGIALTSLAVLVAMLAVLMALDTVFASEEWIATWVWVCINYSNAAVFGAILAWLVRTDGLRVTLLASVFLVLCFVLPAVVGHPGSQAPLSSWIVLLGAVPVMSIGAAISQVIRRRIDSSN